MAARSEAERRRNLRQLVIVEVVSYLVEGLAVLYYWTHASYFTIGLVLTLQLALGPPMTLLWFWRTDS